MAVINMPHIRKLLALTLLVLAGSQASMAVVLPEQRSDVMYHRYDGGGVTIDGPSVLVRKNFAEKVSVSANYYVDNISSASIDVTTSGASRYSEERTEYSLGASYLYDKSLLSAGVTKSDENDYQADTFYVSVSQDMFGDLTNINFGYARGNDTVEQTGNDDFKEDVDRQNYRLGISQIVTPSLIISANYEGINDEGFLNNPYRSYRFLNDPLNPSDGYQLAQEIYPETRSSDAFAIRAAYYLPYRAALKGEYRYFTDDWGIDGHTYQLSYTHPFRDNWVFDFKLRFYNQDQADFYSDLFAYRSQDAKDYRARDKELSQFNNQTIGIGVSYLLPSFHQHIERSRITFQWDYLDFDYDNFSDLNDQNSAVGQEQLYSFDADVFKVFFSVWY